MTLSPTSSNILSQTLHKTLPTLVGADCVLEIDPIFCEEFRIWLDGRVSRSYMLCHGFESPSITPCDFPRCILTPRKYSQKYKHDSRNGPSTNPPLVASKPGPTVVFLSMGRELAAPRPPSSKRRPHHCTLLSVLCPCSQVQAMRSAHLLDGAVSS